jgi:hypothetical protein
MDEEKHLSISNKETKVNIKFIINKISFFLVLFLFKMIAAQEVKFLPKEISVKWNIGGVVQIGKITSNNPPITYFEQVTLNGQKIDSIYAQISSKIKIQIKATCDSSTDSVQKIDRVSGETSIKPSPWIESISDGNNINYQFNFIRRNENGSNKCKIKFNYNTVEGKITPPDTLFNCNTLIKFTIVANPCYHINKKNNTSIFWTNKSNNTSEMQICAKSKPMNFSKIFEKDSNLLSQVSGLAPS